MIIRILHFCEQDRATSWQRSKAFESIDEIDLNVLWHTPLEYKFTFFFKLLHAILHRLKVPRDKFKSNQKLIKEVESREYDIIFIEKCLVLTPRTLRKIKKRQPNCKLVLYMLDDFQGKGNNSIFFLQTIPLYDLISTNKKHNIIEYKYFKAQKVFYFKNAFSEHVHRPYVLNDQEKNEYYSEVCFIGTFEKERAESILYLANNGIKVTVWGWSKDSKSSGINHPNIINKEKHVYFDEFAKVISGARINLNFLRKANRDTETTRSIEIPACGGFMIAERTDEHKELFSEDIEAAYFSSKEELLSKILHYQKNIFLTDIIGQNAKEKCENLKLEYKHQLMRIINEVC